MLTIMLIMIVGDLSAGDLSLWYNKPANSSVWEEAVPLGNGRLGAMVFGGVDKDTMILNEDSLWSGWPEPRNDREGSYEALVRIRKLLKEKGDQKQVNKLALEQFCSLYGYGKPDFGAYQSFCNANFLFDHDSTAATNYRRELNIKTATATVSYKLKDVDYNREYFCSYPDNILVMRFTANKKKQISFTLGASSQHKDIKIITGENELILNGQVTTGNKEHPGMTFQAVWKIQAEGGVVSKNDTGDKIIVRDADAVTIIAAGATNYKMEYPDYKGDAPDKRNKNTLKIIGSKSFKKLRLKQPGVYACTSLFVNRALPAIAHGPDQQLDAARGYTLHGNAAQKRRV